MMVDSLGVGGHGELSQVERCINVCENSRFQKIQEAVSNSHNPIRLVDEKALAPFTSKETDMRVMVLVKATEDSEKGALPTAELLATIGKFNEELIKAGVMKAGDGLKPSNEGKRIAFNGADRKVIDGPFAATRELVAGFWLWEVKDMAEAVAWAKRCPNPMPGPSELEIRPLYELEDFQ
jgi:hypothetical protein